LFPKFLTFPSTTFDDRATIRAGGAGVELKQSEKSTSTMSAINPPELSDTTTCVKAINITVRIRAKGPRKCHKVIAITVEQPKLSVLKEKVIKQLEPL
jgi:hypothetical protein